MKNSTAVNDIIAERQRQIDLGHTVDADMKHNKATRQLQRMAACYAMAEENDSFVRLFTISKDVPFQVWPYQREFKAGTVRKNLVRAAALLVAEIERLDALDGMSREVTSINGTFKYNFELCKAGQVPYFTNIVVPEFYIIHKVPNVAQEITRDYLAKMALELKKQLESILEPKSGQHIYVTSRNLIHECGLSTEEYGPPKDLCYVASWIVSIVCVDDDGKAQYYADGTWHALNSVSTEFSKRIHGDGYHECKAY